MAIKRFALVTALVAITLQAMAGPAAADSISGTDKPGDGDIFADIIRYSAEYGTTDVTVRADLVQSVDPSSWSDGTGINWDLDLDGDGEEEFTVHYSNPYFDEIGRVTNGDGEVVCVGRVSYDPASHTHTNTFPHSCIGSPEQFRVSIFMSWCGSNGSCYPPFDRAPDAGYSNAVVRPAGAEQSPGSGQTGTNEQTPGSTEKSSGGGGTSPVKQSFSSTSHGASRPQPAPVTENSNEETSPGKSAESAEPEALAARSTDDRPKGDLPARDRNVLPAITAVAALMGGSAVAVVSRRFGWTK